MTLEKEYKILVVDDAKDTQMLLDFDLSAAGYKVTCCDGGEEAISSLKIQEVDLILLDMYMPGLSGLETLVKVRAEANTADIPVIMLSASTDEDEVVAALEFGAGDYVIKPYVAKVLLARIRTAIRLKEKTAELEYLAQTDFLTGINNRGNFFELSSNAISLARRAEQSFAIVMFDIDFFKPINDNYGHDAGDQVLRVFSHGLNNAFRDYDIIGRVGGEEFAACLPNTNKEHAMLACERFREFVEGLTISVTCEHNKTSDLQITVSIGVVLSQNESLTIDELLKKADSALYFAKENGRNQVVDASLLRNLDTCATNSESIQNDVVEEIVTDEETITEDIISEIEELIQESDMVTSLDGIDFEIGVNNVLGDEDLFKEILVMFYQDHKEDGDKIQSAIESQDFETLKHLAHTLKGVSCSVGAMQLFEITKELDTAVNERTDTVSELSLQLQPELSKVMKGIELHLDVS